MAKIKILLADDDRVILTALSEGLEESGYEVLRANNGKQALALCLSEQPELAILDISMPEMTGIEVAHELSEQTDIPCIFLTAYSDESMVASALTEGTYGYLVKPIDVTQLKPAIEAAILRANDFQQLQLTNEQLDKALQQDRSLNVAIGLMMERHRLTERQAFEALRKYARSNQCKMTDLTSDVLQSAELLNKFQSI